MNTHLGYSSGDLNQPEHVVFVGALREAGPEGKREEISGCGPYFRSSQEACTESLSLLLLHTNTITIYA